MNRSYTERVALPGGQDRLRQAILYVCQKSAETSRFGRIKLNKILWKSDFDAYAERGRPVTGRNYQRLPLGPAPREMLPLYREMLLSGLIKEKMIDFGDKVVERRPIAVKAANLDRFDKDDISYLDSAISYYWDKTGRETSDDSHGAAWKSRNDGDSMPYESSLLSDKAPKGAQLERLSRIIDDERFVSL